MAFLTLRHSSVLSRSHNSLLTARAVIGPQYSLASSAVSPPTMASPEEDDFDLPSELPLSSASSTELPAELDLGDGAEALAEVVSEVAPALSRPLEPAMPPAPSAPSAGRMGSAVAEDAAEPEGGAIGSEALVGGPNYAPARSGAKRRGRPNHALMEALERAKSARADDDVVPEAAESQMVPLVSSSASGCRPVAATASVVSALVQATSLAPDLRAQLVRRPVCGLSPPSPVAAALSAAYDLLDRAPDLAFDGDVLAVGKAVMAEGTLALSSKQTLANSIGVDRAKLTTALPLLASALYQAERIKRARLEEAAVMRTASLGLLLYAEFAAYDETPLPVRMRQESGAPPPSSGLLASSDSVTAAQQQLPLCSLGGASQMLQKLHNKQGVQKVVQVVQQAGLLVKAGDLLVSIISDTVCPLSVVESGSAANLKACQVRLSGATLAAKSFDQAMRLVCTDSLAANLAAERSLAEDRGFGGTLHKVCDIHKTATSYSRTFSLLESNVSGMIHCALSLREGAAMSRFRGCLRDEVASRFEVKVGAPSREAVAHKKAVLQTFVSHGTCLATRRILLVLCPNGDWRAPKVQHFVPPGMAGSTSRALLLEHVTAGLITAMCASQPEVYPRHRWTGADISTDRLGVLESCHQLLSTSYRRFLASFEPASRARKLLAAGHEALQEIGRAQQPLAIEAEHRPQSGTTSAPIADDIGGQSEQSSSLQPTEAGEGALGWAEVNAKHRREAARWVASNPFASILLQRLAMEPLRAMLSGQFALAGDAWDRQQMHTAVEARARGDTSCSARQYRLSVAASGALEERFFEKLNCLWHAEMWRAMPTGAFTVSFCAVGFKVLSRSGCCVQELLKHPHEQMPVRMFRLLDHPEEAAGLLQMPDCRWERWSMDLRRSHPSLSGDEFFAKLTLIAHMSWVDISRVEAKHATIRRILTLSSAHTHQQSLGELSAFWCFLQARKLRAQQTRPNCAALVKKKAPWGPDIAAPNASVQPSLLQSHIRVFRAHTSDILRISESARGGV